MPSYLNKVQFYSIGIFLMVNILVTGGTGFIGIILVKELHRLGHSLKLVIRERGNLSPFKQLKEIKYGRINS